MATLFYIVLGLCPSTIWLLFYLRKDKHPEPNSMVLRFFLLGILIAPFAVVFELLLVMIVDSATRNGFIAYFFLDPSALSFIDLSTTSETGFLKIVLISALIPALIEEYLKYSRAKFRILKNSEFDEPIDVMLYCIIAALGFAAIENILVIFGLPSTATLGDRIWLTGFRFLGATLVHALASGTAGYFLALGLLNSANRKKLILTGISIAILFHACYNYLIGLLSYSLGSVQEIYFILLVVLLVVMAFFVSNCFVKIKKISSVCKINQTDFKK